MSRNIEIKARLTAEQYESVARRAVDIGAEAAGELIQRDTFFHVPQHRLKLRQFPDAVAELIAYEREDCDDPIASNYFRVPIEQDDDLLQGLSLTLGVRGVVEKTRQLFLVGQTRIHLDHVKTLGHFLELEVVLSDDETDEFGQRTAERLMRQLGVGDDQLVSRAYIDLIEAADMSR